jgi:hypothetical protein
VPKQQGQRGIFQMVKTNRECETICVYQPSADLALPLIFDELNRLVTRAKKQSGAEPLVRGEQYLADVGKQLQVTEVDWIAISNTVEKFLQKRQ